MEDVALLAVGETTVESKIVPAAKASGVPTDGLLDMVKIKKVWKACRAAQAEGPGTTTFDSDVPLPQGTRTECDGLWTKKHGFTIGAQRLLVSTQQNPMHAMSHAEKKDFPIVQVKRMRVQSGNSEAPNEGDKDTQAIEDVRSAHIFYLKVRAFWTTMAYVNIDQTQYMTYEACEETTDKILGWLHQRHRAGRPPTSFFVNAWEATSRVLQTGVRKGEMPKDLLEADSSYQHFWTVYNPETKVQQQTEGNGQRKTDRMQDKSDKMDTRIAKLQQEKDRQISALKRQLEEAPEEAGAGEPIEKLGVSTRPIGRVSWVQTLPCRRWRQRLL